MILVGWCGVEFCGVVGFDVEFVGVYWLLLIVVIIVLLLLG